MQFIRGNISLGQDWSLLAYATTRIPSEFRAKYFRDLGISTVHANVYVDAIGKSSFQLHAIVFVKLTYKGDMVRSSERTRKKINQRLEELAQEYCLKTAHKELVETTTH